MWLCLCWAIGTSTDKARLCSSHSNEEDRPSHKGSQAQHKWRKCGGQEKRRNLPQRRGERKKWLLGVVTPDPKVGWMNRSSPWGSLRRRLFQADCMSMLTSDLSNNLGCINRTENVGHQQIFRKGTTRTWSSWTLLNKMHSSIWFAPSFQARLSLIPSGKLSDSSSKDFYVGAQSLWNMSQASCVISGKSLSMF